MGVLERVELRVRDQLRAKAFYTLLLGRLGHGGRGERDEWSAFWNEHADAGDWFAFAEDAVMIPGTARVALRADRRDDVDRAAALLHEIAAKNVEGPCEDFGANYYAVRCNDPDGNKLEICCVTATGLQPIRS